MADPSNSHVEDALPETTSTIKEEKKDIEDALPAITSAIKEEKNDDESKEEKKEAKKDDESNEVIKDDKSKDERKDDESKDEKKDDESKEMKKDDESNEVKKDDESNEVKKDDETNEVKKDDETNEVKKDDETNEVKKDNESNEVKKNDESNEVKKDDESKYEKKDDESKEVKKDDESNEKKDDESKVEKVSQVSFLQLFRYATPLDKLMMIFGSIGAIGCGSTMPIMILLFSNMIQAFLNFTVAKSRGEDLNFAAYVLETRIKHLVLLLLILAFSVFALAYLRMFLWMAAGERQAKRVRQLYYAAILRQDIAYFDNVSTGDITNRITSDSDLYQEGISEKVGAIFQNYATFIAGFTIAFITEWKIALVVCCLFPFHALAISISSRLITSSAKQGQDAYGEAGAIVEQALSGIRTVMTYGGENHEIKRYTEKLQKAYVIGKKKALVDGLSFGSGMLILYSGYALAFWYGSTLIVKGEATGGDIYSVFFSILVGALSIGNSAPSLLAVNNARGAASNLFSVIDRVPSINSASTDGKKLDKTAVNGRIEFRNVKFHYPTRPDVQVLKNFSLTIEPGETVALVGSSGSGKSTIVNLLERFYDPIEGQILLDGEDIKNINIKSLRTQIGLVSQEPSLFPTSIQQNVAWGFNSEIPEPSLDKVIEACKKSNAHDFIDKLPQKYDTDVGENGSLMSGGQKQRIAIARALIKNPAILLLDEATSALDTESEQLVQEALDFAATERTTIVIAHRLSTIKNADKIVVMSHGDILEVGRHDELIASKGVYYGLVQAQGLKSEKDEKDEDVEVSEIPESNGDETKIILDEKEHKDHLMKRVETKTSTAQSEIDKELMEKSTPFARVFKLQKPELPYIIVGTLGAIVGGMGFPLFSIIFSIILDVFANIDNPQELRRDANFWSGMFVVLAVTMFVAFLVQRSFFGLSAERLSKRLRIMVFTHLLKQEIGFFDEDKNSVGALTLQLSTNATKVDGLAGSLMSSIVQSIASLVSGLIIAFIYGWKLTLVILSVVPLLFINGFIGAKAIAGYGAKTRKAYEETYQIVHQSVANMRTIASLTREETFNKLYQESIKYPHTVAINGSIVSALGFGISQAIIYLVNALAVWYGGQLIATQEYTQRQMFNVLFAVIYCAIGAGQASSFTPDVAKAKNAAISIFEILDRKSQIDPTDNEGKDRPTPVSGSGELHDVHFNYPTRPDVKVLNGLGLTIDSDKTIALVGGSGSGKSTVISLCLRYYDALSGEVNLEKINVKNWNLEYLRANMGTVSQEPVLFDITIGENIAYGKEGCSQEEIEAAAKDANIHDFIIGLPQGYNTLAGERGTQLSGGQKQRIAIARALIRQPKLLLLDEATSALDSESEKIVQDALDKAAEGRTTITIAHRLSTIQDADLICVMKKGEIVEQGQHFELIRKRGYYYDLVNKQTLI